MNENHSSFSPAFYNKNKQYICTREDCNNPVRYHLISNQIHKICSACASCKKDFDKMTIPASNDVHIKNDDNYVKMSIKVKESGEHGFYTIDFSRWISTELDMPYLEWIKIHD